MSEVSGPELRRAKGVLRRDVLARRDALSPTERDGRSAQIRRWLLELAEIRGATIVMAFWSFGSEVDTGPLLEELHRRGKDLALPRIQAAEVVPVVYEPGDPLRGTSFGAMEPAAGHVLDPAELDAVVTPGVAFDRRGGRIGYGGGYYDRLLPRVRAGVPRIGIAFALQVVDEVPGTDPRVHLLVTEDGVIRCR